MSFTLNYADLRPIIGGVHCMSQVAEILGGGGKSPTGPMKLAPMHRRSFGSKFPAICNYCAVMAAWSRKTLKFCETFCVFWKKDPNVKIFKLLFRKFSLPHRSTCCVQISWNLADRKSVKSCVAYLTEKNSLGSPAVATARIMPKICQPPSPSPTMFWQCSRYHPNPFTFGRVIAERVNIAKTRRKANPMLGWSAVSSRIKIRKCTGARFTKHLRKNSKFSISFS